MILIGQYDSSFVRRVGIALTLYGIPFEHRPWSTFGDADRIRPLNPLTRVPVLVLDDGEALIDSHVILDHVDSLVPAAERMYPAAEPSRRRAMRVAALATGLADKAVSLFYDINFHNEISEVWAKRCRAQIASTLAMLEADRAERDTPFWFGETIGHADIAVACALRHAMDSHPEMISLVQFPALAAHCARLEAMPVFKEVQQEFIAPAR